MIIGNSLERQRSAREYIESGAWKCSQSPTGSHHWVVKGRKMECKYCKKVRSLE